MKKLYFLLLSLLVLSACDKEDKGPALDYPATFELKELYNTTSVRMYTSSGEVKNAALIKAFATKWGSWYHVEDKKVAATTNERITFLSGSEAELNDFMKFEIRGEGSDWVLTAKEPYTSMYSRDEEHFLNLSIGIRKYKPAIFDKQAMAPGSGGPYMYKSKDQFITSLQADALQVHRIVYTLKAGDKDSFFVRTANASNRFDASGLSLLQGTDTLLVQEFVVVGEQLK